MSDSPRPGALSTLLRSGWPGLLARLTVGGVMIVAGYLKVLDPDESTRAVLAYKILPDALVRPVGYGLPILEIVIGVLLVLGLGTRIAAAISAVLLVVFIIGIFSAWARGLSIDCGCFGGGGQVDAGQTKYVEEILRDTGLLALAAFVTWRPWTRFSLDTALGLTAPPAIDTTDTTLTDTTEGAAR